MHKDQTDPAVAPRAKHIDRFAAGRQPNRHKQTLWSAMLVLASSFTAVTHADPSHPEDPSNTTEPNHAASQNLQAQFDQLIAEIQATGEPILAEDIQPLNIPDHDNKAVHIRQAFAEHWPTVPGQDTTILETDWYGNGGIDPDTHQPISDPITDNVAYLAQCQPLIDQVLKAKHANQSDWQREYIP